MKKYQVQVTISVSAIVEVSANTEERALELAKEKAEVGDFGSLDDWYQNEVIAEPYEDSKSTELES